MNLSAKFSARFKDEWDPFNSYVKNTHIPPQTDISFLWSLRLQSDTKKYAEYNSIFHPVI